MDTPRIHGPVRTVLFSVMAGAGPGFVTYAAVAYHTPLPLAVVGATAWGLASAVLAVLAATGKW
jgi:hypothetical protein